eukprot:scaffold4685_cov92-Isochrysis_galbana.AAC.1
MIGAPHAAALPVGPSPRRITAEAVHLRPSPRPPPHRCPSRARLSPPTRPLPPATDSCPALAPGRTAGRWPLRGVHCTRA